MMANGSEKGGKERESPVPFLLSIHLRKKREGRGDSGRRAADADAAHSSQSGKRSKKRRRRRCFLLLRTIFFPSPFLPGAIFAKRPSFRSSSSSSFISAWCTVNTAFMLSQKERERETERERERESDTKRRRRRRRRRRREDANRDNKSVPSPPFHSNPFSSARRRFSSTTFKARLHRCKPEVPFPFS